MRYRIVNKRHTEQLLKIRFEIQSISATTGEVNAVDYLLTLVDIERFIKVYTRYKS